VTRQPALIPVLAAAGLDALEVYHSDHPPELQREFLTLAATHHLLVTGGSDFHGDDGRDRPLGRTTLPAEHFERLLAAVPRA
jgi:3',5'-nucleoside bisphosphate phosphatase